MDLLGQRDISFEDTPRFGCYVMSLIAMPQLIYGKKLSVVKIVEIIKEAQQTPRWQGESVMCVDEDPKLPACKKYVWNPGKTADIAFIKFDGHPEYHCWQVCDESGWYPWASAARRFLTFKVLEIRRPKGVHFRLADAAGVGLYNPIPGMDFPLTGHWIGFAVGNPI